MPRSRVLAIGLDGLEITLAERLMAAGELPGLAELRRRAACFRLDHGAAQRTGLAWEHVASGLSPDAGRRWAAVEFDPTTYTVWQEGARFTPWWADLAAKVVVFDAPYVDLQRAPNSEGIVGWGAHDPGVVLAGNPSGLLAEFEERFGDYPAVRWMYGKPFPSSTRTQAMGDALSRALDVRSRAARWLVTERCPDWNLSLVVAGEIHGAIEGLWHGVDPDHPHHRHPSAAAAKRALLDVHRALDRMVANLLSADQEAVIVAFTMGGMGQNHSDVPSMVLLAELLYRDAFGRPLLTVPSDWAAAPANFPILDGQSWSDASTSWVPSITEESSPRAFRVLLSLARRLPKPIKSAIKRARAGVSGRSCHGEPTARLDLHWQPATRYRRHWAEMPAFALPSFYDGRIRINLRGREHHGRVEPSRYEETCQRLEAMVRECRDPRTGEPVVDAVERASTRNPLALTGSEADLLIVWRGVVASLQHPRLGLMGPVPLLRTGGHTGRYGMAYVAAPGVEPGDRGVRSAFDVVPTIATLLGHQPPAHVSGRNLL